MRVIVWPTALIYFDTLSDGVSFRNRCWLCGLSTLVRVRGEIQAAGLLETARTNPAFVQKASCSLQCCLFLVLLSCYEGENNLLNSTALLSKERERVGLFFKINQNCE